MKRIRWSEVFNFLLPVWTVGWGMHWVIEGDDTYLRGLGIFFLGWALFQIHHAVVAREERLRREEAEAIRRAEKEDAIRKLEWLLFGSRASIIAPAMMRTLPPHYVAVMIGYMRRDTIKTDLP